MVSTVLKTKEEEQTFWLHSHQIRCGSKKASPPIHLNVGDAFNLQWRGPRLEKNEMACGKKSKQNKLLEKSNPTSRCGGQPRNR